MKSAYVYPEGEHPFGPDGESWGLIADISHAVLLDPTHWTPGKLHWVQSDHSALFGLVQLEQAREPHHANLDYPWEKREALEARFREVRNTFHGALPFSEPERYWLTTTYTRLRLSEESDDDSPLVSRIRKQEGEIMASGLRQVVKGRDLMRRWWAWRRETAEFEGQGNLVIASAALTDALNLTFPGCAASIRHAARFPRT
jgi:hypothetical protein